MNYKSDYFATIGSIIWILVFISGIILGFIYKILVYEDYRDMIPDNLVFNWGLMIITWFGSFIAGSVFMFFSTVIYNQDKQNKYLRLLSSSNIQISENNLKQTSADKNFSTSKNSKK